MQDVVDNASGLVELAVLAALIFYTPFADKNKPPVILVFGLSVLWSSLRIFASFKFRDEPDVPLMGFLVTPFFYGFIAGVVRAIRALVIRVAR